MVPEEYFGLKTADVTRGVQRLLLDSVRLVISLQKKKKLKMINLNIYLFISYLIVSVKLNYFSWKRTENKEEVALITGNMKEPWAARQVYYVKSL